MKKRSKFLPGILFLALLGGCGLEREQTVKEVTAQTAEAAETTGAFGTASDFKENMEQMDFYVQEGRFGELDTAALATMQARFIRYSIYRRHRIRTILQGILSAAGMTNRSRSMIIRRWKMLLQILTFLRQAGSIS